MRESMSKFLLLGVFSIAAAPVWAADSAAKAPTPTAPSVAPDEIIRKFAAKEAEFAEARGNYTYRQTVKLLELDAGGGQTGGKWELVEDIIFSPDAKRTSRVVYAPVVSLQHIILTPSDEQDLRDVQPFVLTTKEIPQYDISYLGKQNADEIPCYVFAVKPKKMVQGKRYFEGQIWVDDRDFQIVKTYGKGVGVRHGDEQFPRFETYREQIDGNYWFPTYTRADDTLHFKDMNQRVKMTVKYENYKRFEGRSTIKFGDVVDEKGKPQGTPTQPPATAPSPTKK
jgi:hypothetical protein